MARTNEHKAGGGGRGRGREVARGCSEGKAQWNRRTAPLCHVSRVKIDRSGQGRNAGVDFMNFHVFSNRE